MLLGITAIASFPSLSATSLSLIPSHHPVLNIMIIRVTFLNQSWITSHLAQNTPTGQPHPPAPFTQSKSQKPSWPTQSGCCCVVGFTAFPVLTVRSSGLLTRHQASPLSGPLGWCCSVIFPFLQALVYICHSTDACPDHHIENCIPHHPSDPFLLLCTLYCVFGFFSYLRL